MATILNHPQHEPFSDAAAVRFEKGFTMVEEEELGIAFCTRAKMRRKKVALPALVMDRGRAPAGTKRVAAGKVGIGMKIGLWKWDVHHERLIIMMTIYSSSIVLNRQFLLAYELQLLDAAAAGQDHQVNQWEPVGVAACCWSPGGGVAIAARAAVALRKAVAGLTAEHHVACGLAATRVVAPHWVG